VDAYLAQRIEAKPVYQYMEPNVRLEILIMVSSFG
jgi:hypothetical protein